MSSLIGIMTNYGIERIVLASDRQVSDFDEDDKMVAKGSLQKIHYAKKWAMGYTGGGETKELRTFFGMLRGDGRYGSTKEKAREIMINALKNERFYEVCELNAGIARRNRDNEYTYSFLLGTNFPKFGLWEIDQYGNLLDVPKENEFDYVCVGSGSDEIEKYISRIIEDGKIGNHEFDKDSIDASMAIRIAKGSIQAARADASTGFGYDLIVVSKKGDVEWWGDRIKKKLIEADKRIESEIANHYKALERQNVKQISSSEGEKIPEKDFDARLNE